MATYVSYANFLRGVMPMCPGVPQAVAIDAVRNACIEFCTDSRWLQYKPDAQNGVVGVATYGVYTPNDTRFVQVQNAWWDAWPLKAKSNDELEALYGVDWTAQSGTPAYYTQTDDSTTILMVPTPQISEPLALTMLVSICPTRDSLTVDGSLYENWFEVICEGAKARLMATPAQAFSNQALALVSARKFKAGKSAATIERNTGLTRNGGVMRPPRFV